ncbi:MAG: ABC transporter ATP-binding protein [Candidatus Aenigmarchaeota archaeon]|nr:ABC transporter ATP-binding protein [Candidatus Aenigmarchaeota archaeon]
MSLNKQSIIDCQNLSKTYFISEEIKTEVLKNVSFSINKEDFVAIMGPSGCGKSTLMYLLGCLDISTSGKYFFDKVDVSTFSNDQLANFRKNEVGFVFQNFNLLSRSTVLRNVILPLVYAEVPREEREERARIALNNVGLDESHFQHLSNQLSGGQMQRVAIARALVNNPSIILADEPTGNLDSKSSRAILSSFQKFNQQGQTIILITHEQYVADYAKRIIYLHDGKIIKDKRTR